MELRRLFALVKHLPADAMLWAVQEPKQNGSSVDASNDENLRPAEKAAAFFAEHFGPASAP